MQTGIGGKNTGSFINNQCGNITGIIIMLDKSRINKFSMKVVQNNIRSHLTKKELLEEAKASEAAGDLKKAESFYGKLIKADPHNELAYNRLMIIYRKQKELNKELETIKEAIRAFEDLYASAIKAPENKKISNLSNAFLKVTGLANKKGKLLYLPEPLAKWNRRKALLEKKLKKS